MKNETKFFFKLSKNNIYYTLLCFSITACPSKIYNLIHIHIEYISNWSKSTSKQVTSKNIDNINIPINTLHFH